MRNAAEMTLNWVTTITNPILVDIIIFISSLVKKKHSFMFVFLL